MTSIRVRTDADDHPDDRHRSVTVFAGPDADHRACVGRLLCTPTEADAIVARLADPAEPTEADVEAKAVELANVARTVQWDGVDPVPYESLDDFAARGQRAAWLAVARHVLGAGAPTTPA